MSDAELAFEVGRAEGRTIIGLKDPAMTAGVDNRGQVLVADEVSNVGRRQISALGARVIYEFEDFPVVVAEVDPAIIPTLRRHPYVDYLEPSAPGAWAAQVIPWNVERVQAPGAWPQTTGSGVKLLVIDSGIAETHPDVSFNVAFRCISGPVYDQVGHGTAVIGVASAHNDADYVVGVSHGVQIWSANVEVNGVPLSDEVACSLNVGRINGVFAANMSLVLAPSAAVTDQINAAYYQSGMVLVAAAGNNFGGSVSYPAYLPEVLAVAATTIDDVIWQGSASGMQLDISAPGENVLTTTMPGLECGSPDYIGTCTGTSFAAPHVAAAAALLKARYPSWANTTVRNQLISSALSLGSWNVYGAGLLRSQAALLYVTMSGPTMIESAGSYTWQANPSGGSTYGYTWQFKPAGGNWVTVGSQQSYQTWVSELDNPYFDLHVTVSSDGFQTSATRRVNVQIGGCAPGPC